MGKVILDKVCLVIFFSIVLKFKLNKAGVDWSTCVIVGLQSEPLFLLHHSGRSKLEQVAVQK